MDALSPPSFAVFLPGCGFLCSLSIRGWGVKVSLGLFGRKIHNFGLI
jgi:hypothetical protein